MRPTETKVTDRVNRVVEIEMEQNVKEAQATLGTTVSDIRGK